MLPLAELTDVYITDELMSRPAAKVDYLREKLALQDLARQMAEHPEHVLPRLVSLAMEACGAASAGLSLFEPEADTAGVFRWHHLTGVLERFSGATTPRDFSPCGVCLDEDRAVLARHPERVYDWIANAGIVAPEVLLVPLRVGREKPLGTLWIVARPGQSFDAGHARVATELAAFAGLALRMIENEKHLTLALDQQATLTREMSHRIQNLFAVATSLVALSERAAQTPREMATALSARLGALARAHAIVNNASIGNAAGGQTYDMRDLVRAVLKPYDNGINLKVSGPRIGLTEQSVVAMAIILHELATNASKYGAFFKSLGAVAVEWRADRDDLVLLWDETGGPPVLATPARAGFGSKLIHSSIKQMGGSVEFEWHLQGLQVRMTLPAKNL